MPPFNLVGPGGAAELVVEPAGLDVLLEVLRGRGFNVVGPTARDGAIVYDEITSGGDLPVGWTDVQDSPGARSRSTRPRNWWRSE